MRALAGVFAGALLAANGFAAVEFSKAADHIEIKMDGKPFSTFYFGTDSRKPYLHPLRTSDGRIITRSWPMEDLPGESHDHPHHKGLWITHGDVNGYDFWANNAELPKQEKLGRVNLVKINSVKASGNEGTIDSTFNWVTPEGQKLLEESRKMTFREAGENRIIDFDVTLKALEKTTFGDTKEGMFAIRLVDTMTEKAKGGQLVSSTGATGMANVWGKAFPWVDYSGTVAGKPAGIAIFDHPGNPKHPTYWHARDYGLFAANIFGEHDFFNDKNRNGSLTLEPGKSLRLRYRVVIHPGDMKSANLAKMYEDYK